MEDDNAAFGPLPEATTGLGSGGLRNPNVGTASGKENASADGGENVVLTKGAK